MTAGPWRLLDHWRGGLLDPQREPAAGAGAVRGVTAYRRCGLVLAADDPEAEARARERLDALARRHGLTITPVTAARDAGRRTSVVEFEVPAGPPGGPDAWTVLREYRERLAGTPGARAGLDHLLTTAEQVGGNPFALDHGRPGLDRYGAAGYAGRGPISVVLAPPAVGTGRRPRVVVLDTAVGTHPWLGDDTVEHVITFADGSTVGPVVDPDDLPGADDLAPTPMLGALGTHAGHGTFISGLIRQACPEAIVVAPAVMGADGVVPESTLVDALEAVLRKQTEQPGWADAVVLSLGYYAETGDDLTYTSHLRDLLLEIGRCGIATFCAAGNDASTRPSFPAAFAADPAFAADDVVPLMAVAALNPDGSVAAFSNDGPWVNAEARGVNMASTVPVTADGSGRAAVTARGVRGHTRSAADPDDFVSGFASWSGTSFAAPALAGQYLTALRAAGYPAGAAARREHVPIGRTRSAAAVSSDAAAP
ncbi:S8 family serine peptidase [Nakamurella sp. YIM 132087]|uniref:S8 family serine peptidase n=1 Tax=Nakamurella alba TaxID=2665158 RepID=A0A7K1FVD8_9ACTN|nr:S8 family serine peptidase [Nakamurella alba]MTD16794.1 S8 family serine peptidase [Nakamurella alba]